MLFLHCVPLGLSYAQVFLSLGFIFPSLLPLQWVHLNRSYREEGNILFQQVHRNTKRGNRHKPQQEIFQSSRKGEKQIYHGYGGTPHQMLKEDMESWSLQMFTLAQTQHLSLMQFPAGLALSRGLDHVIWGDSQPELWFCNNPYWRLHADTYVWALIRSHIGTCCICASSTYQVEMSLRQLK